MVWLWVGDGGVGAGTLLGGGVDISAWEDWVEIVWGGGCGTGGVGCGFCGCGGSGCDWGRDGGATATAMASARDALEGGSGVAG